MRIFFLENASPYNPALAADEEGAGGEDLTNEMDKDNDGESTQAWRPWRHCFVFFFFFFSPQKSSLYRSCHVTR